MLGNYMFYGHHRYRTVFDLSVWRYSHRLDCTIYRFSTYLTTYFYILLFITTFSNLLCITSLRLLNLHKTVNCMSNTTRVDFFIQHSIYNCALSIACSKYCINVLNILLIKLIFNMIYICGVTSIPGESINATSFLSKLHLSFGK